jgi:hypothetical protein
VFLLVDSPISHDTCDKAIDFVVWPTGFEVFVILEPNRETAQLILRDISIRDDAADDCV